MATFMHLSLPHIVEKSSQLISIDTLLKPPAVLNLTVAPRIHRITKPLLMSESPTVVINSLK